MLELSKADRGRLDMLVRGLVSIGRNLPAASRPYYVAWLDQLVAFGSDVLFRIGGPLGVLELSHEALLFSRWGEACEIDDFRTCAAIERHLDAAGVRDDAIAILPATQLAAELVAATLPTMGIFESRGRQC